MYSNSPNDPKAMSKKWRNSLRPLRDASLHNIRWSGEGSPTSLRGQPIELVLGKALGRFVDREHELVALMPGNESLMRRHRHRMHCDVLATGTVSPPITCFCRRFTSPPQHLAAASPRRRLTSPPLYLAAASPAAPSPRPPFVAPPRASSFYPSECPDPRPKAARLSSTPAPCRGRCSVWRSRSSSWPERTTWCSSASSAAQGVP